MPNRELGWAWFETSAPSIDNEPSPLDDKLAHVFARCFRGEDGIKVLKHLKHITHSRIIGPTASDALLRHIEGQRQLVSHIISLVEHGRSQDPLRDGTSMCNSSAMMETTYE